MVIRRLLILLSLVTCLPGAAQEDDDFQRATPGYAFSFPRDHGSHPEFKLEWWYLTGHLREVATGRRFGFHTTFFRAALRPWEDEAKPPATPLFDNRQAFLAHVALLDVATGKLHVEERLNRQGWDAMASVADLAVTNGNWSLIHKPEQPTGHTETMTLRASILADARFELTLMPLKPKVIFGENGVSIKSSTGNSASHYVTFTRLATEGTLQLLGNTYRVEGLSWMDHEFSSSQLGPNQVGWDWASIQLIDGREIMLYRLRHRDGTADPASQFTWIDGESRQTALKSDAWEWKARRVWTSPDTKANYPIDIDVTCMDPENGQKRRLRLRPLHDAQEIVAKLDTISYWEGACEVLDETGEVIGQAYVELTGYDGRLGDRLR